MGMDDTDGFSDKGITSTNVLNFENFNLSGERIYAP